MDLNCCLGSRKQAKVFAQMHLSVVERDKQEVTQMMLVVVSVQEEMDMKKVTAVVGYALRSYVADILQAQVAPMGRLERLVRQVADDTMHHHGDQMSCPVATQSVCFEICAM